MANNKNVNAGQFRFETNYYGLLYGKESHIWSLNLIKILFQGFIFIFINVACLELFNGGSLADRTRIRQSKLQSCWRFRCLIEMSKWYLTHRCFIKRATAIQYLTITRKGFVYDHYRYVTVRILLVQTLKKCATLQIIQIVVWWSTTIEGKTVSRFLSKMRVLVQVFKSVLRHWDRPSRFMDWKA